MIHFRSALKAGSALLCTCAIVGLLTSRNVRAAASSVLVTIQNTTANPVPTMAADNPDLQAVQFSVALTPANNYSYVFYAPAGKRLVIEKVNCGLIGGNLPGTLTILAHAGGTESTFLLPLTVFATSSQQPQAGHTTDVSGTLQGPIYVDPLVSADFYLAINPATNVFGSQPILSFSGHYANVPVVVRTP